MSVPVLALVLLQLPVEFDLRDVNGDCFVPAVRAQTGGTCWAHGTMAAMESNLLITGEWEAAGETGEPDLAEYHLDWWNGFNGFWNPDLEPPLSGLTVHQGGDYLISAAYVSRGDGTVRELDAPTFTDPSPFSSINYHHYIPRSITWMVAGWDLEALEQVKMALMTTGAVATCIHSSTRYLSDEFIHYQPVSSMDPPTHAVAIIGWNDTLQTQAELPGAWLCRNSWGSDWGLEGYFWVSYWDKWAGRDEFMGAVAFSDVELSPFTKALFHDLHGWRDTFDGLSKAINAFCADEACLMDMVSFCTAADSVSYCVKLFSSMAGGVPVNQLCTVQGLAERRGLHTVELSDPIELSTGDSAFVLLELSSGGHPFDRTAEVPVLLGASMDVIVGSASSPGESYYFSGGEWLDLWDWSANPYPGTGNFCIKLLGDWTGLHVLQGHSAHFSGDGCQGPFQPDSALWTLVYGGAGVADYRVTCDGSWLELSGETTGTIQQGDSVLIVTRPVPFQGSGNDTLLTGTILFENLTDPDNSVSRQAFLTITRRQLLYSWPMDQDPGWETSAQWEWGVPTGGGGETGSPDPAGGYTGMNVLGYNLSGDYENGLSGYTHTATIPMDCSGASAVQLRYRRWLGSGEGDSAEIVGSGDGGASGWQTIWSSSRLAVLDSSWVSCVHDISGFADNSGAVTIVWLLGPTNSSGTACGWNIDDVEIWGSTDAPSTPLIPQGILMGRIFPNPALESASVYLSVNDQGTLEVSIYDLCGRMVRRAFHGQVSQGLRMMTLDLSGLPAGWYGVQASLDGRTSSSSLLKL